MKVSKQIRTFLGKLKFALNIEPQTDSVKELGKFIPQSYKSVLIISADFELAWAWIHAKGNQDNLKLAVQKANQARKNIPKILDLCNQYSIPITWATVGHLFLENCDKINGVVHLEIKRLGFFENNYWKFNKGSWFDFDPCSNYEEAPEWYAPDLIKDIISRKVQHEIGCHTFSHIDCRDEVCSTEVFKSEISECNRLAYNYGVELKSFVHPGHTIGNLDCLKKLGFTNYRTNNRNVLGYPRKNINGLWEFEQTAEFTYRKDWSINYHIYRFKKIIDRAIKSKTVCYFWFHPSMDEVFIKKIMPEIFAYIEASNDKIWVTTTDKYTEWLEENYE